MYAQECTRCLEGLCSVPAADQLEHVKWLRHILCLECPVCAKCLKCITYISEQLIYMLYPGEHQKWEGDLIFSPPRRVVSRLGIWTPDLSDPLHRQWRDIGWGACLDVYFQTHAALAGLPGARCQGELEGLSEERVWRLAVEQPSLQRDEMAGKGLRGHRDVGGSVRWFMGPWGDVPSGEELKVGKQRVWCGRVAVGSEGLGPSRMFSESFFVSFLK